MNHSEALLIIIITTVELGSMIVLFVLDFYHPEIFIEDKIRRFRTNLLGKWLMDKTIVIVFDEPPGKEDMFTVIDYFSTDNGTWLTILGDHGSFHFVSRDTLLVLKEHKIIKYEDVNYRRMKSITIIEPNKNDML